MEIEVMIEKKSFPIEVADPHHMDHDAVSTAIHGFLGEQGVGDAADLGIPELLPKMVRGVAGCEAGCPANAQSLVQRGVTGYRLAYVEGGILMAERTLDGDRKLEIKIFPDF